MKLNQKSFIKPKFLTKRKKKYSEKEPMSPTCISPDPDIKLKGGSASTFFVLPFLKDSEQTDSGASMSLSPLSPGSPSCTSPTFNMDTTDDSGNEQDQDIQKMFEDLILEVENGNSSDSTLQGDHSYESSGLSTPDPERELEFLEMDDNFSDYKGPAIRNIFTQTLRLPCGCEKNRTCHVDVVVKHVEILPGSTEGSHMVKVLGEHIIEVCHHPKCLETNKEQQLLLCRSCDVAIHSKPDFSGHLVLDAPKKRKPFSPPIKRLPDLFSNDDNSDDTDEVDGLYIQEKKRSRSPSEIQKKLLLKRKKALKKKQQLFFKQEENVRNNSELDVSKNLADTMANSSVLDTENSDGTTETTEQDVPEVNENSIFSTNIAELNTQIRSPVRRQSRIGTDEFFTVRLSDESTVGVAAIQSQTLHDALLPVLNDRGMDIRKIDVYVTDSNTPLPMECSTFLLAGATLRVKEKDVDVFNAKNTRSNGGNKSSNKSTKSAGGSLRGNKRSNLSIDDSFLPSTSPGGTLTFSEGKKIKSQNKLSNLFNPPNKDREKHDQLNELLTNYSTNGLPPLLPLVSLGKKQFKEENFHLEADWREIVDNSSELSKMKHDQQEAIWELIITEKSFIQNLRVITDVFKNCLLNIQNNQLLSEIETEQLFSNIDKLEEVNCVFWEKNILPVLNESRQNRQPLNPSLLKKGFTQKFHKLFKPYVKWCIDQKNCVDYQRTKYNENELFKTFVVWAEAQKQCNRLKLSDLLAKPMQRLTIYSLLMNAILKKTEDEEQQKDLQVMIANIDKFVTYVNQQMRNQQEQERYESIITKIESYDAVEAPNEECVRILQEYNANFDLRAPMPGIDHIGRKLLMQSALRLKESSQSRVDVDCFLFTDLFLICKSSKRMDKYKVSKPPMRLDRILVHDLKDKGSFLLIYLNEYHVPCTAYTFHANESAVKCWLEYIRKAKSAYNDARLKMDRERLSRNASSMEHVEYTPLNKFSGSSDDFLRADSVESNEGRFIPNIIKTAATPVLESENFLHDSSREDSSDATLEEERSERISANNSPTSETKHTLLNISRSVPSDYHNLSLVSNTSDSDPDFSDVADDDFHSKSNSRRISRTRTEKRYHTADSIQDMNKRDKDSSIYKRLSWNYGMGDLQMDNKNSLRNKTMSTDSIRSIPSSSGVSSTGSLHIHTESEISEEVENGISPNVSIHMHHEAFSSIDSSDLEPVTLTRESKKSKSKSTSDIVQMLNELKTSNPEHGISSVDLPEVTNHKKLTPVQFAKMKKQLLLNSNVEASEV